MRLLSLEATSASLADLPAQAVVCHDVRNPAQRGQILARKGTWLSAEALRGLLADGVAQLHLALPQPGDVAEDAAATRLAAALAGPGVTARDAHLGQTSFVSSQRGMLRVDRTGLDRINALDGVLLLTAEAERAVDAGQTLGVVKCAPLFLPEATLASAEASARSIGPVVSVETFSARRVALIAPTDRLRAGAFDRARAALSQAVDWYGSTLDIVVGTESSVPALASAYQAVADAGAELILAAGASGTDPLDIVFDGLRQAGGEVLQMGIPAEPGTACWIGRLGPLPVLGLATCELFGQPGALDLLLPLLFGGEALDQRLVRRLAYGGLLLGPSRIAPYHAPQLAAP